MEIIRKLVIKGGLAVLTWQSSICASQEVFHERQPLSKSSDLSNLPAELFTYIVTFTRISDGIRARETSKDWSKLWDTQDLWKEYCRRLPGWERAENEAREKSLESDINYKSLLRTLLTPRFSFIDPIINGDTYNPTDTIILGLSDNGQDVIGYVANERTAARSMFRPYVWRESAGMQFIESQPWGATYTSHFFDISDEGDITTRQRIDDSLLPHINPFLLEQEDKVKREFFNTFQGKQYTLNASNKAGTMMTGIVRDISNSYRPFVWKYGQEIEYLPVPPGFSKHYPNNICENEQVIVGTVKGRGEESYPIIWSAELSRQGWVCELYFNQSNKHEYGDAYAVSGDSLLVAGDAMKKEESFFKSLLNNDEKQACIWINKKPFFISDFFKKELLKGFSLRNVSHISRDGTIVVGRAKKEGWLGSYSASNWHAYIPRLDILKKEGLSLPKG